jgi:hypothetical protein
MTEQVKFKGIDGWNRPVFQSLKFDKNFFGSVDKLFDDQATEQEVLQEIEPKDLVFFGNHFGCEPMGDQSSTELEIIGKKDA